jgi:pyruvate/2-oxoglutarate/acetoin dehydrogenase E1 component
MYERGIAICRDQQIPVLFHVTEVTQPQGHSTSGSHERYKTPERLAWEDEFDCIRKFRSWILENALGTEEELDAIQAQALKSATEAKKQAWSAHLNSITHEKNELTALLSTLAAASTNRSFIEPLNQKLSETADTERKDLVVAAKKALRLVRSEQLESKTALQNWLKSFNQLNELRYSSHLHSESAQRAALHQPIEAKYNHDSPLVDGREVLQANWDVQLQRKPELLIFGEDVGHIGGVNQTYAGLQGKYGDARVFDTGIREATIIGQGIGLALRGLRPVAEIQYLDYLAYAIQVLTDDLACLQYRTRGGQKAPLIITTRGHRLEGVWHSGSPMQFILGALRGIHVLVPRNMTQAAGFYNTLLASDEPALVIEPLNGYRIKEQMPENLGDFSIPIGEAEVVQQGNDITLVTYGSCVRIAQEAIGQLAEYDIQVELIDARSLLPFDTKQTVLESLRKTGRLMLLDEDVPGGATAFMLQEILETQGGFRYLDQEPVTLTAKAHRPAYGSDGDYFSKPSTEDVFDAAYRIMHLSDPTAYPPIY